MGHQFLTGKGVDERVAHFVAALLAHQQPVIDQLSQCSTGTILGQFERLSHQGTIKGSQRQEPHQAKDLLCGRTELICTAF